MCGINGYIGYEPGYRELNINRIRAMNSLITHRGPDDEGIYADEYVALGMKRLSIIDLSTGRQPIFNEDETKIIIFNGEIYNFQELRKELLARGHIFKTKGDTETILHAYEEFGEKCLNKLNGMFAFAIYDINTRKVFIGRDRVGEKPLYYYFDQNCFIFASELKSIIKVFREKREINEEALYQYFSLTYIPAPLTIYKNIYKLEAGCSLSLINRELSIKPYWDINIGEKGVTRDYEVCKKQLREALFHSVEKKMISDVPIGAFLSGGIDSSIVVGIMSKISKRPVDTFTMGFKVKGFDESGRASIAAEKNRTNHHLHFLDYNDALEYLDTIIEAFDEPFSDSSAIPTYFVSKYASEFVKVVLTGDAGDELFGGYSKYMIQYYTSLYNKIPKYLRKNLIEKLLYAVPDRSSLTRKLRKVIGNTEADALEKRINLMKLGFGAEYISELLNIDFSEGYNDSYITQYYNKFPSVDELFKTLYTDFKVVLEGDMLVKVDRMSMTHSIETRAPMLDPEVIELAFQIPSEYKIKGRSQKHILKDTFRDLIPEQLMHKSKRGFAVPIGEWFLGPLKSDLLKTLSREVVQEQGIFKYDIISKMMNNHFSGKCNHASQLWSLYVFQKWYERS